MIFAYPAIAIILSALIVFFPPPIKKNIYIGGKKIKITEARSIASKATGLAGKPDNKGKNAMLFKFAFSSKKNFLGPRDEIPHRHFLDKARENYFSL